MKDIESKEDMKKQKDINNGDLKEKAIVDKFKKRNKKLFFFKLLSVIFMILIVSVTIIVVFLIFKNKNTKSEDKIEEQINEGEKIEEIEEIKKLPLEIMERNNSIIGVYLLEKGKETIIFNPEKINLSENDCNIEIIPQNIDENNTSSNLRFLQKINSRFISELSGKIEIKISFNILLTSMFELFKNCNDLLEVDLSTLESSNLKELNSTFENCENLENVNLTLKNGTNIISMDNSFNGCKNLKDIDLSNFIPKNNISMQYMFRDCISLNYVDLSNFYTFNFQGIFSGCINLKIYNNIDIFRNTNNIYINISLSEIINSIIEKFDLTCEIGEFSKCKTCQKSLLYSQYCDTCNEGYYIPYQKKRKECLKCQEHCKACIGTVSMNVCYRCEEGYYQKNGLCIKKCDISNSTQCNSCNPSLQHLCEACNNGYFLPEDDKTKCKKCDVENCNKCEGNVNFTNCVSCEEDFILSGYKCLKNCTVNEITHCKKCNSEEGKIDQCIECIEGFYLPEDNNTHCENCSVENCEICENNNCSKCFDGFLSKIENDTIISCYEKKLEVKIPERIDIIRNGTLQEGVIEIVDDFVKKTQLDDSIRYHVEGTCNSPYSSGWWKGMNGKCYLKIYYNISNLLPENIYYLQDDYILYLNASKKFAATGASYREYMANPFFYQSWGPEWGGNSLGSYGSPDFGVYKDLERVNHNGYIFLGGVYNRGKENGYEYIQLEGFNYATTVKNGTGNIGWNFNIGVGQYISATVKMYITFKVRDLFLIRKKN